VPDEFFAFLVMHMEIRSAEEHNWLRLILWSTFGRSTKRMIWHKFYLNFMFEFFFE
jgi:hypothetical protein